MPTDGEILAMVNRAFAKRRRPEHFTNHTHCSECLEHDELLRSRDTETLTIGDVGNMGWDPICFITAEGYAYYFPALARLALAAPEAGGGWYGAHLFSTLCLDGPRNNRFLACNAKQRKTVVAFLHHVIETRAELVDINPRAAKSLFEAIEIWSD